MISLKHRVFLEVASHLSFTKAGLSLFISQPAISKHVQDLENHYKSRLFERKGGSISLTAAGTALYAHLLSARTIEQQIEFDLGFIQNSQQFFGELKLGASTTVALYIIPPILSSFHKNNPQVKIQLLNRNSENILKALLNNEIDLGIIEGKNKMADVNSTYYLSDSVIPVCAANSPLPKKSQYKAGDLKHIEIALRERGSGTLAAVEEALSQLGIRISELNISMRLGGTEALKNFILADECLGFLPMKSVVRELAAGELVKLNIDGLSIERKFYFIQRQGENSSMNNAFIKFALQHNK